MKTKSEFFSGFIYGTLFTLLISGVSLFYYKTAAEIPASTAAVPKKIENNVQPFKAPFPPVKGNVNAPVTIVEYADFFCGYCKKAMPTMMKIAQAYPGKVKQVFKHYPLSNTPGQGSFRAHEGGVCAQEQGKFWPYYEKVFASAVNSNEAALQAIASQIGLDLKKFNDCLASGRAVQTVQADIAEGQAKGIRGTPTFYINGFKLSGAYPFEKFQDVIESFLKTGKPPADLAQNPAAPAPMVPPPVKVEFNDLKGRPSWGSESAPVTLVEFSDYHCPFCQRLDSTMKKILEDYKDKVRVVWRHFPLSMHPGADRTHLASECAFEQGKFAEYHEKIFMNFKNNWTESDYENLAVQTGLDAVKFKACMQNPASKNKVQQDVEKGRQAGVRGTPAIFLNGALMTGAQPYESYKAAIEEALKQPAKK